MINPSLRQKLREFGVEESKIESTAEKAMQDFNKTEEELEELVDTWLKSSSTNEKTKKEKENSGEQSAAAVITLIIAALYYFISWFSYKDQDGWLVPYLFSFLSVIGYSIVGYQIIYVIVILISSLMKTVMDSIPKDRRY